MHALNSVYCSNVSNVDSQYVLILKTWDLILYSQNFQVSNLKISWELRHQFWVSSLISTNNIID